MILVIDVGNTNITLGIFDKEELFSSFRMTTKIPRTSDEYGIMISDMLRTRNVELSDIEAVVIASVVPGIMHSFKNGILKYLKKDTF